MYKSLFQSKNIEEASQQKVVPSETTNTPQETEEEMAKQSHDLYNSLTFGSTSTEDKAKQRLLGDHLFGASFIGSDEHFGKAVITEKDGILHLEASHESNDERSYVKLSGTISIISNRKFEFNGKLEANNLKELTGQCKYNGKLTFYASGTRVYWRMQEEQCWNLTGYTDIYFNSRGTRDD